MDITKQKAEYIANKTNDLISDIYKQMCDLQAIMNSEQYQAVIDSDKTEIIDVREFNTLPSDFFQFIEQLPEMF